ncbi:MAG: terminase [Clostridia bacterium]|nr:terminase [Clostridia bacterium]
MPRPDQSFYLAHFTKNGEQYNSENHPNNPTIEQMSALERLVSILMQKRIIASNVPWTNRRAVCFTECPWGSLLRHADNYSPYGLGFTKKLVYSRNGNPVIYANPTLFHSQGWSEEAHTLVTPFVPFYAADKIKKCPPFYGRSVDYTHEREWRVAKDFAFSYINIRFVILKSVEDLQGIPESIISEIGIEKFIYMDTYKKIEELWPTHIMD